jgi:hypothetical protein
MIVFAHMLMRCGSQKDVLRTVTLEIWLAAERKLADSDEMKAQFLSAN